MLVTCLEDIICGKRSIIGVRDYVQCGEPEAGLYIQDLPAISLKSAAQVAGPEYETGAKLLQACIVRATRLVFSDFLEQAMNSFDFNAIVEGRKTAPFKPTYFAQSVTERGLVYRRWRSEVSRFYVEEIYVKVHESGVFKIKIYDDGILKKEISVDAVADRLVKVRVDESFNGEELKIVADNTNFSPYTFDINRYYGDGHCYSCSGNVMGKAIYCAGWDGTKEVKKGYGIGAFVSVRCHEEFIICSALPRLYMLLWYRSGIEYYNEFLGSNRFGALSSQMSKEQAAKNRDELQKQYNSRWKTIVPSLKQYIRSTKGECFNCQSFSHYAQVTP